jgi:hypothetical protein
MPKTLTKTLPKVMVIANQIENTSGWKYIGSDIGIAIAWVMKSAHKRDMTCDEDDHGYAPRALKTNKNSPSSEKQYRYGCC